MEDLEISSLDSNPEEHIILPISLTVNSKSVDTFALLDSGATSNFVNMSLVQENKFPVSKLDVPRKLKVVDGRSISSGDVTTSLSSEMSVEKIHKEKIMFHVAQIGRFPVILGLPWLKLHTSNIHWNSHKIEFVSPYCVKNCSI